MSETATGRTDHNRETETKEDSNKGTAKEIWKESLVDASGNPIEPEDKEEVEAGEEAKEVEEGVQQPPGVKPELQYSREELYEIQKHSLSQVKPDFLDRYPIQARFSFVKGVWERNSSESGGTGVGGANSGGSAPSRADRWARAVTPNETGTHDGYSDNKLRRGENRMSRGKDQQQDASLILSPQRRSFNFGCYLTGGGSLLGARESKTMDRENMGQSQGRRFGGSGRVPWTDPSTGSESTTFVAPNLMPDYTQRRDGGSGGPPAQAQGGGGGFERRFADNKRMNNRNSGDYNNRSNGDYHRNSGGDYSRNGGDYNSRNNTNDYGSGGGRYNGMNGNDRRRNNSDNRNHSNEMWDEPEWYSGGPTSQNDVIDLHGFQDDEKDAGSPEKNRKNSSNSNSENERGPRKSSSSSSGGAEVTAKDAPPSSEGRNSRNEEQAGSGLLGDALKFGEGGPNLDDLLNNLDTFPDLLTNGTDVGGDTSAGGGSRFSRWFRKESPAPPETSPSPHHMINDLINDITDENRPLNSNTGGNRFAPISPVFSNQQQQHRSHQSTATSNFLDMMLKNQADSSLGGGIMRSGSIRDLDGVGKLHSVEELEAKIRHTHPHPHHPHSGSKEEDMANFKKLLAKSIDSKKPPDTPESALASSIGPGNHIEIPNTDPSLLPHMMSKLLQQQHLAQNLQQHQQQAQQLGGNPWGNLLAAQNNSNYQELVHKMLKIQQAQEYQRRMAQLGLAANNQQGGGFLPPHHSSSPVPPEIQHHLLNNPQFDARNLIRPTVGSSPLSPSSSSQQVPSSFLSSGAGPNFLQPGAATAVQPGGLMGQMPPTQAAQQFMLGATAGANHPAAPGNNSVFQQRIPSPNQLAAHTQSILQNAILKKKMEEQKEVLRKRQELLQRAGSPNSSVPGLHHHPHGHPHQSTPGGGVAGSPPVLAAFTPTSVLRKMTAAPPSHHQHQESPPSGAPQHEKDLLLNHSQGGEVPWSQLSSRHQQPSLALKNNLLNLGNQQISGGPVQVGAPNPRSKFTLSSKLSSKSSSHLPQSLAEQMSMMSQDLNLKSAAQQHPNPFTSHLASHHSQSGALGGQTGMASPADQLEKWFSPEFLARARSQGPPPAHNLLSVEELERLNPRHPQSQAPPTPSGPTPPASAGAVQN